MIPRLYDLDDGCVLVDGVNVKDYKLENLRAGIGMVLQKNLLFSGTIEENLKWGDENATEDEIRLACSHAAANKFIETFSDGYETVLDQGGTNVSGGQKQRLLIARAVCGSPDILILDDSSSALDYKTDANLRRALAESLGGTTKITVAQRVSSVMSCDLIIVLEEGKIADLGTHEELLSRCDIYREISDSQMGGAIVE